MVISLFKRWSVQSSGMWSGVEEYDMHVSSKQHAVCFSDFSEEYTVSIFSSVMIDINSAYQYKA
jgi:hypothetical protein